VADEPTAALDVTTQAQILTLLRELVRETGAALLMTTHDLGVVAGTCETVNVLYGGRIVERAQRHRLFGTPRHPYTHGLLGAIPRLDGPLAPALATISGSALDRLPWAGACAFAPRCSRALPVCGEESPVVDTSGGRLLRCHNPVPASAE
jgi:peptide/nickel transport system ATP-binding protein